MEKTKLRGKRLTTFVILKITNKQLTNKHYNILPKLFGFAILKLYKTPDYKS